MAGLTAIRLISDGTVKMDGGVVFGQVPKGQWQEWLPADRRNRIRLNMNCLLLKTPSGNFLIDCGSGQKLSPEMRDTYGITTSHLIQALKSHMVLPQDITGVILTSLRFEHTGGCTKWDRNGQLVPTFPKATYYVQRKALEEAMNPNEREAHIYCPADFMPIYERNMLKILDGDTQLAPGLQVWHTPGPTAGHQIVLFTNGGEWVVYLGDLIPTPYHLQLACISATDRHPEQTLESKKRILADCIKWGALLVFSHGPKEHAGYLEERTGRQILRPINLI
jgi:glyoxylase-like metal-dependent hydrolase (beta-lactamase superfamily II)